MARKRKTACTDPGRLNASGSVELLQHNIFLFISQVRAAFRRKAKSCIVCLALWGLLPISWADKLVGELKHD
jgi:hypothetical protein